MAGIPGQVYAGVVALAGQFDIPDSTDLSTPDVVGVTLLTPISPSANVSANLVLTLPPGWYALVFGSGLFGATGALAINNNTPVRSERRRPAGKMRRPIGAPRTKRRLPGKRSPRQLVDTNTAIPGSAVNFSAFGTPSEGAYALAAPTRRPIQRFSVCTRRRAPVWKRSSAPATRCPVRPMSSTTSSSPRSTAAVSPSSALIH